LENFSSCGCLSVLNPSGDKGTATSHTFGIKIRVVLGYARAAEQTHKSASHASGHRPGHGTSGCGYQPSACNYWPDTRNGQEPQTGQKATDAAHCSSNTGTDPGIFGGVRRTILVVLIVDVTGNDADVGVRNAGRFESIHRGDRGLVGVIKGGYRLRHRVFLNIENLITKQHKLLGDDVTLVIKCNVDESSVLLKGFSSPDSVFFFD
jgi:hypothetical protein